MLSKRLRMRADCECRCGEETNAGEETVENSVSLHDDFGPLFPGKTKVVHVGFDDPSRLARKAKTEEDARAHYRCGRDEVRAYIEKLPGVLKHSGEQNKGAWS